VAFEFGYGRISAVASASIRGATVWQTAAGVFCHGRCSGRRACRPCLYAVPGPFGRRKAIVRGASSDSISTPKTVAPALDYCVHSIVQGAWCSVLGFTVRAPLDVQAMPTNCKHLHIPQCVHRSVWLFALELPPSNVVDCAIVVGRRLCPGCHASLVHCCECSVSVGQIMWPTSLCN
jgi:hypothetical protein